MWLREKRVAFYRLQTHAEGGGRSTSPEPLTCSTRMLDPLYRRYHVITDSMERERKRQNLSGRPPPGEIF
ncbi:hypothetical protein [Methanoregula sp.]|uniref:hypothetical protein n=1 Tax=Methanoregula sp. TaxID=2052170 RepID=UPI003BB0AFF8